MAILPAAACSLRSMNWCVVIELLVWLLICCVLIELPCRYWTNKKENLVIGLVNLFSIYPIGKWMSFRKFALQKNCNQSCSLMTFGLVHASCSLHEWEAVKLTFFAPCLLLELVNDIMSWCMNNVHCLKSKSLSSSRKLPRNHVRWIQCLLR